MIDLDWGPLYLLAFEQVPPHVLSLFPYLIIYVFVKECKIFTAGTGFNYITQCKQLQSQLSFRPWYHANWDYIGILKIYFLGHL